VHAALALALGDVLTVLHQTGSDGPATICGSNAGMLHPLAGSSSVLADRSTTATIRSGSDHSIVQKDAEPTDLLETLESGSELTPGNFLVALICHSRLIQGNSLRLLHALK
jgi:hypothetical protein